MRLLPGGNVGIGTTAPGQKLDVTGSIRAVAEGMTLGNTSGGIIAQRTSDDSELYFGYRSVPDAFVIGASYSTNGVYKPLILATSDTARMTILTNGNVGIGTTTPSQTLDVNGNVNIENANGILLKDTVTGTCALVQLTSGVLVPTAHACK